jgi:8-oxo-dGTP diphosphatase
MTKNKNNNPIPAEIRFAALAVDVVCFSVEDGRLDCLLGEVTSDNKFKGQLAHIGGLIRVNETAEQSVDRLLEDKAGIKKVYKEQLYTFSDIDRDPRGRVVSVAYICFLNDKSIQDTKKAQTRTVWRPVNEIGKLSYDHNKITTVALERLRAKIIYTDIAKHFMPKEFTLSDLQKVYEAVLGEGIDKRNFRKRIMSLNLLTDTKRTVKKGVMRPAALYSFKSGVRV